MTVTWTECVVDPLVPCTITLPVTGMLVLEVVVGVVEVALDPPPPHPTPMIANDATRAMVNIALLDLFPANSKAQRPKTPDAHSCEPGIVRSSGRARADAIAEAVTVNVTVPDPLTEPGETVQTVFVRADDAVQLNATLDENPLSAEMVMLSVDEDPRLRLSDEVAALIWKSGVDPEVDVPDSSFTRFVAFTEPKPVAKS